MYDRVDAMAREEFGLEWKNAEQALDGARIIGKRPLRHAQT